MRRTTWVILLAVFFSLAAGQPAVLAADHPVYVVHTWQDYLRMAPVSAANETIPVLFDPGTEISPEVQHFSDLYSGSLKVLDGSAVQEAIARQWPRARTVVIAQDQPRLGLVAACLAAALQAPLYFDPLPQAALRDLQAEKVITVGQVSGYSGVEVVLLAEIEQAQQYYNQLIGDDHYAVLATDDEMGFLAVGAAAFHHAKLLFAEEQLQQVHPQTLAWLTKPEAITRDAVYRLYDLARYTETAKVYTADVGILTGFSPQDVSLLLARTFTYPKLTGDWKMHYVYAEEDQNSLYETIAQPFFDVERLMGGQLTRDAFLNAIQHSGHVWVEGHGSPNGIALADGGFPNDTQIQSLELPPLVFVAESCDTANLHGDEIANSIALKMIHWGAVAYVGSMEVGGMGLIGKYPFVYSTPTTPLGALVRLQNAARVAVDADRARGILIGDPAFHQFDRELVDYQVSSDGDGTRVQINPQETSGPVVVDLKLPVGAPVVSVTARRPGNQDVLMVEGVGYLTQPFSADVSQARQEVLLEWPGGSGEVILSTHQSLPAIVLRAISDSLVGAEGIYIDLLLRIGGILLVIDLAILAVVWSQKRRLLKRSMVSTAIFTGAGMGILVAIYSLGFGFAIPWPLVIALGLYSAAVVLMIEPVWGVWSQLLKGIMLYTAPLILVWLVAAGAGISHKTMLLLVWGMVLTGVVYGVVLIAACLLSKFVTARSWRSKTQFPVKSSTE